MKLEVREYGNYKEVTITDGSRLTLETGMMDEREAVDLAVNLEKAAEELRKGYTYAG